MADEAILSAAREFVARCERADRDVRHELALMTASVATVRATARTIDSADADTREHADGMARELATDVRNAAAVLQSSGAGGQLAAESLKAVEHGRFTAGLPSNSPVQEFAVPPPSRRRSMADEIKAYALPAPEPSWVELVNPLDLAEELAHAAADVAVVAAGAPAAPEKERPVAQPRGTKETA